MIWRRVLVAWLSPCAVLCGIVGWAALQVGLTVRENRSNLAYISKSAKTGVDDVFAETRDVTIAVLKPCRKDHPETCGLVPAAEQTVQNVGVLAAQGAETVQQSDKLVTATTQSLDKVADTISGVRSHLDTAVDNLGDTAKATTVAINAGTDYFQKKKPQFDLLLSNLDDTSAQGAATFRNINSLLTDPTTHQTQVNVANVTGSAADFMKTGVAVENKLSQCTLHPTFKCMARSDIIFGAQVGGYLLPK